MTDYLKDVYMYFRPLLEELSKLNIDFSKAEPEEAEMEIVKKRAGENLWGEDTAMSYAKKFFYERVEMDWRQEVTEKLLSSTGDNPNQTMHSISVQPAREDIGHCLEKYKKDKTGKKGIVWVLMCSGATLEGHPIDSGIADRNSGNRFDKLLKELQFSEDVKNIYNDNGRYRFNALKSNAEFFYKVNDIFWSWDAMLERKINNFCEESDWETKYERLLGLLQLWKKKDNRKDKKIDYRKYRETLNILIDLIPTVSSAGIVKTIEEYQMEREIIERELYDYYTKQTIGSEDGYLQKCLEGSRLEENFKIVIDRIHQSDFTNMQKDFLMDRFLDEIDSFCGSCRWILDIIDNFQERCAVWKISNEDYEYYQDLWNHIIRQMEEYL